MQCHNGNAAREPNIWHFSHWQCLTVTTNTNSNNKTLMRNACNQHVWLCSRPKTSKSIFFLISFNSVLLNLLCVRISDFKVKDWRDSLHCSAWLLPLMTPPCTGSRSHTSHQTLGWGTRVTHHIIHVLKTTYVPLFASLKKKKSQYLHLKFKSNTYL